MDIDGDGIPDETQALTAVEGIGGAVAGTAGSVEGSGGGLFKRKKRGGPTTGRLEADSEEAVEE